VVLISLGGGLGWLLLILPKGSFLGPEPIDLLSPEAFTFHFLYGLPHLSLARSAMLGGLMMTFHALRLDSPRRWLPWLALAGLCWLVRGLCVPFFIGVLYLVLGVWGIAAWVRGFTSPPAGVFKPRPYNGARILHTFPIRLFVRCVVGAVIPAPLLAYSVLILA